MNRKKAVCLIAVCLLIFAYLPIRARAVEAPGLTLSAPDSVKQGEKFEISIAVVGNPGLASMQLRIVFPSSWRFISAALGEQFSDSMIVTSPSETSPVTVVWSCSGAEKISGEVLRLSFEADINAAAEAGLVIVQCQNAYTGDEEPVALAQKSARISVVETEESERPALKLSYLCKAENGQIAVKLSAYNGFHASAAQLRLEYDAELMELTRVVPEAELSTELYWCRGSPNITWSSLSEITAGEIATCYFSLLNADGDDFPIKIELSGKLYDISENEIQGTVFKGTEIRAAGSVTISGTIASFGDSAEEIRVELWRGGVNIASTTGTASYSFGDIATGDYVLKFTKKGHGTLSVDAAVEDVSIIKDAMLYMLGDVNRNGTITATDANWIRQYVVGGRVFDDYQMVLADVNQSGGANPITATDANWVRQRVVGARDELYVKK